MQEAEIKILKGKNMYHVNNYILQINGFWNWRMFNEISHSATDLYFAILHCANKAGWVLDISIPNSSLCNLAGIADRSQLNKIRNQLIQHGLIEYTPGKKGKAGIYRISVLYDTNKGTNVDTNKGMNDDAITAPIMTPYINKNKNENKNINNIPPLSPKNQKKKSAVKDALNDIADEKLKQSLEAFIEMRKSIKKPLTHRALLMIINKLNKLAADTETQCLIIEQSILHCWQDVYPLKQEQEIRSSNETNNPFLAMARKEGFI